MPFQSESRNNDTPLRRNGRRPACEPCRQRKLACDHGFPVCSRCKGRNAPDDCVYVAQKPRKRSSRPIIGHGQPEQRDKAAESMLEPLAPVTNKDAFFGATGYRHAMHEAEAKMTPLSIVDEMPDTETTPQPKEVPSRLMSNGRTFEAAMRILRGIPTRKLANRFMEAQTNPNYGWCRLAAIWLHASLWQTFGTVLDGDRSTESLIQLATLLCDNSAKPLREDYSDAKEWFASFSAHNMRWEGLGILFTFWAFRASAFHQRHDCSHEASLDYSSHILKYKHCAWDTIEITRTISSGNTLLLFLLYQQGCLESNITGDDSLQCHRIDGETASLLTHLGLHALGGNLHDRRVCTQIKRRVFSKIFHGDKVLSTFAGWPPMLSQRFVSTPLPLDISDEVLLGVTPWRDGLIDEQGWNTLGEIYPTTLLRARAQSGYVRELILNITLQATPILEKQDLLNLREKQENILQSFPEFIIFKPDDVEVRNSSGLKLYAKLLIRLEHLQNIFLIERLLSKLDNTTMLAKLIETSLEIVTLTLIFWTHRDIMNGLHQDFEWLVIGFASPAAGILCLELLKTPTDQIGPYMGGHVSRSDMIQKLSLLNGFLGWIKPLIPNRKLTDFVKRVIERVLDQTLNQPASSLQFAVDNFEWDTEIMPDMNDFTFELFDTFDWLRPERDIQTLAST